MAEKSNEIELADAARVKVLETNILHASDVIFWLDGSSAEAPNAMARITSPLSIEFTQKPSAVKYLHSAGKTAFWQTPTQPMHAGLTTDAERARPAQVPFVVAGSAYDPSQRFNPAAFEVSLGAGSGRAVLLYPSPLAPCVGGYIQGRALFANNGQPLIWGMLNLEVTVGLGEALTFKGQTDAKGDFRIALKRLPPLPLNTAEFSAILSIQGDAASRADIPADTSAYLDLELESATQAGDFNLGMDLAVSPGQPLRINSINKLFIAVQTV